MTPIEALIERLEKATGPSREIDLEIGKALDHIDARTVIIGAGDHAGTIGYSDRNQWASVSLPLYTASIDAAVSLCERVLPNDHRQHWTVGKWASCYRANIKPQQSGGEMICGDAPTAALALCLATLRARAAVAIREGVRG